MRQGVAGGRRWTRQNRCPVCGGCDQDARGNESRCYGFTSDDGRFIHCSREEHAGDIQMSQGSQTFGHLAEGPCRCGSTHRERADDCRKPNEQGPVQQRARLVKEYSYRDEHGDEVFQVVRLEPKSFRQRWYNANEAAWVWKMEGVTRVLYRLPELVAADPALPVYIVEGEKDADALAELGVVATTNPGGAGKWRLVDACSRRALAGRHVVIVPDADQPGRRHADDVASLVVPYVASIRRVALPAGKDASDWIAAGGTVEQLEQLRLAAPTNAAPDAPIVPQHAGDPPPPLPDPWKQALAKAASDIEEATGRARRSERVPMFIPVSELFRREYPPTQWLVTGLITRGGIALLGAEPKSCKTWLATEIAVAIATGTPVCGEFFAERGRVAYFYAEDLAVQIRNRVRALAAKRGIEPASIADLLVCPRGKFLDVTKREDLAWLVASCRMMGQFDLVVLDPLRDVHSAAEDKSDEMGPVMRNLRLLGELLGCTVAVAHHASKATKDTASRRPGQRMRGSSAIHGSTDSGIYFGVRGGDGVAHFDLGVDVEIKGAKSAGFFGLTLSIEDSATGESTRATWSVDREAARKPSKPKEEAEERSASDDFKVLQYVRKLAGEGTALSKRALRSHVGTPFGDKKMRACLERLLGSGQLMERENGAIVPADNVVPITDSCWGGVGSK
jgi:hypothetical protein